MKTRMWVVETDQYGMTDRKFYVDDPSHIPRIGDYIDNAKANGKVSLIRWQFKSGRDTDVVFVFLKGTKG